MISDKNFSDWHGEFFGYGYGSGEEFWLPALVRIFSESSPLLRDGKYDHRDLENEFGGLAAWLLINILCHADIFEYGASARFGWLTLNGERLRDYLSNRTLDALFEITSQRDDVCLPNWCNCTMTASPCNPLFRRTHGS